MTERPIPVDKVLESVCSAARTRALEALPAITKLANLSGIYDEIISYPALAALIAWGPNGVAALKAIAAHGFLGHVAQRYLLAIGAGFDLEQLHISIVDGDWLRRCNIVIDVDTRTAAVTAMRELVLAQANDERIRRHLLLNLYQDASITSDDGNTISTSELFLSMLLDARLVVNESLLNEFSALLDSSPQKEEALHRFLVEHPVLLDPLALEVRSKHELGDDFITDFVIKRFNDEYVLVEIEKSTDRIFTATGRLHSQLTDAISQVRDFQSWIHDNIAYARTKLPGIRRPEGLVVIGRSGQLTPQDRIRLDEENFTRRGHIKIVTYDELLEQARTVYRNMLEKPIRVERSERPQ